MTFLLRGGPRDGEVSEVLPEGYADAGSVEPISAGLGMGRDESMIIDPVMIAVWRPEDPVSGS